MENKIFCVNQNMFINYTFFYKIRTVIIQATCKYVKLHIALNNYNENNEENNEGNLLLSCIVDILEDNHILNRFIDYCNKVFFVNLLSKFGIYGLFALCNKSENNGYYKNGYYSIGNSYDICELLKLIKPYLIVDNKDFNSEDFNSEDIYLYDSIINLENIFQESLEKKHIVTIS